MHRASFISRSACARHTRFDINIKDPFSRGWVVALFPTFPKQIQQLSRGNSTAVLILEGMRPPHGRQTMCNAERKSLLRRIGCHYFLILSGAGTWKGLKTVLSQSHDPHSFARSSGHEFSLAPTALHFIFTRIRLNCAHVVWKDNAVFHISRI